MRTRAPGEPQIRRRIGAGMLNTAGLLDGPRQELARRKRMLGEDSFVEPAAPLEQTPARKMEL